MTIIYLSPPVSGLHMIVFLWRPTATVKSESTSVMLLFYGIASSASVDTQEGG